MQRRKKRQGYRRFTQDKEEKPLKNDPQVSRFISEGGPITQQDANEAAEKKVGPAF